MASAFGVKTNEGARPGTHAPGERPGTRAQVKYVRMSAYKARVVLDLVRGMDVAEAEATLRLPSGEMRMVRAECRATVGVIGNADHQNIKVGKAGRKRHLGVRPQTRGTAMNPVDHPHGGGEGSTTPGRHPVTPWGVPTLGYRTRKKHKASDRFIVRGRRRGKKSKR